LRQAFASGVHFLIHKPPSAVQIERRLRAAYSATVAMRRNQHREPVNIAVREHSESALRRGDGHEPGVGIKMHPGEGTEGAHLTAREEMDLRFALPGSVETLCASGIVVWTTTEHAGMRFTAMPDKDRMLIESWLTDCVERSLAELCERCRVFVPDLRLHLCRDFAYNSFSPLLETPSAET
jgi:hypothetical protein